MTKLLFHERDLGGGCRTRRAAFRHAEEAIAFMEEKTDG
jgi:hypothetical protein